MKPEIVKFMVIEKFVGYTMELKISFHGDRMLMKVLGIRVEWPSFLDRRISLVFQR